MLRSNQDAYGHQLYDFFKGRQVIEVVERDDGLIDPSEVLTKYYLSEYKDWTPREKLAAQYVKGRVLDIGCGGGRWSLYLQKKGDDVLGIDISPLAVKVCKERGLRNVVVKSISEVDSSLGKFDTILMMGNNFGLFGSPKQAQAITETIPRNNESRCPHYRREPGHLQATSGPGAQTVSSSKSQARPNAWTSSDKDQVSEVRIAVVRLSARVKAGDDWDTARNGMEGKSVHSFEEGSCVCRSHR